MFLIRFKLYPKNNEICFGNINFSPPLIFGLSGLGAIDWHNTNHIREKDIKQIWSWS